ncbi:bifunctional glutamate/proline--tRNA ligase [Nasonia vitripennis]|uniref:Bifunctional glutamate/proline--tRNA ligase n=1 Tax=Nasonia vitripennis TaxID=7425 RepID=A0A7M7QFY7_NASVI|nr:bifunctional glutamate/proline--tRNA ligase [Nasonia vitripennis]
MPLKLVVNAADPPVGALLIVEIVRSKLNSEFQVVWSNDFGKNPAKLQFFGDNDKILGETSSDVARYLSRAKNAELYGSNDPFERTEVDHWLTYAEKPYNKVYKVDDALLYLDRALTPRTWLVAKHLTIADICVFSRMNDDQDNEALKEKYPNLFRWYKQMLSLPEVQKVLTLVSKNRTKDPKAANKRNAAAPKEAGKRKQEGKFIELPGAEMGKVVVRFPPEASGFLHIGHAKAALLNQYYAENFQGQLIMRFDDTNPAKENVEFEQAILEDLEMLQVKYNRFTHSSDYFDLMLEYCEKLLKEGKAYVDDTPALQMKEQRDQKLPSANRDNSVEKNQSLWKEMIQGTSKGQECCVRAKIDYQSPNGCMRDPTIYRCKPEPHPRTGNKYKVYPTYDFACPIVDAIENVTHTLRTTEYHDRDDQFYWFIEALNLRRPYIWEYSRLNMTNTVLSKRKLTWFVAEGLVDGWDDPRFPTVRGILRRGMTVEGLKQFIIAQGSSRSVVFMEWDKIWAFNKKVIDPVAIRYTALTSGDTVKVNVKGAKEGYLTVANHPKDPAIGTKQVRIGPTVLIEEEDAEALKEGQNATFINWGNLLIEKIRKENGKVIEVDASLNLDNKDYKNTLKLTWIAADNPELVEKTPNATTIPCYTVYFDHIITKPVLGKDDDFKDFVAKDTRREIEMVGEAELRRVKKGEIVQLQRKGFFRCDVPYVDATAHSSRIQPLILFHVPDGHSSITLPGAADKIGTTEVEKETKTDGSAAELYEQVTAQGNKVRDLKNAKADKATIDAEVKALLSLKEKYKSVTGQDYKPNSPPVAKAAPAPAHHDASPEKLNEAIIAQGNKVRDLKAAKADKAHIDCEVKDLLSLKQKYKSVTGRDWKPNATPPVQKSTPPVKASSNDDSAVKINQEIVTQGNKVRDLKAAKADKATIDAEVKALLNLKAQYKATTGQDWKPNAAPAESKGSDSADKINEEIVAQGNKVRDLKSAKASKAVIDAEVKTLLSLKGKYKTLTGLEWKPNSAPVAKSESSAQSNSPISLAQEIKKQGDIVRDLKSKKPGPDIITQEVAKLLNLKAEYKRLTGKDWSPLSCTVESTMQPSSIEGGDDLEQKIIAQGDKVRDLKTKKADKDTIQKEVQALLALKTEYKNVHGKDYVPASGSGRAPREAKAVAPKSASKIVAPREGKTEKESAAASKDGDSGKTGTRLGLEAKKNENLPDWYSQVITKGEMIEYYDVSGCYILRPWSYSIWDVIKDFFDAEIKKLGVKNCYFPIFVSKAVLEREKTHIADFAPEVAWVTKSGDSDLAEHIAIRPTSETVMYPAYAKWLKSYRDLPLKLNQWNNVVRWEFKHPQPFLRTREFLWQEGHTAFATKSEADEEVLVILDLYARIYEEFLAIPVVKGRKTEKEKFAGGDYTTTVEAFISASGRAIQGGTSHHLGQNFSKMFDIQVEGAGEGSEKTYVYQNSWGLTTRTIGVMIMVHGDDKGLVLPPKVASIQAMIVPCGITASTTPAQKDKLLDECSKLEKELLKENKIRVEGDYRDNYSPGWKFNHWELKGVPVRVELGPKDLEKGQVTFVRRDTAERITANRAEAHDFLLKLLDKIQSNLLEKARVELKEHTKQTNNWSEFCSYLDNKNLILAPFCGRIECEDKIKADSVREDPGDDPNAPSMGAKSLCIPFNQPDGSAEQISKLKCIHTACQEKPKFYTLFGRSY